MKHLAQLTTAESLLLKVGDTVLLKELLKYTFLDLLLRRVLIVHELENQPHHRDPVKILKYVRRGPNYHRYSRRSHEQGFLSPFEYKPDYQILLATLIKIAREDAGSKRRYIIRLCKHGHLRGAFHFGIIRLLRGEFSHTREGENMRTELRRELDLIADDYTQAQKKNDKRYLPEMTSVIGGNILLVTGVGFPLSEELNTIFDEELHAPSGDGTTSFSSASGDFDHHYPADDASSHGGSHDGGSDGGDSSDGGCSGDGGCGGCGGD